MSDDKSRTVVISSDNYVILQPLIAETKVRDLTDFVNLYLVRLGVSRYRATTKYDQKNRSSEPGAPRKSRSTKPAEPKVRANRKTAQEEIDKAKAAMLAEIEGPAATVEPAAEPEPTAPAAEPAAKAKRGAKVKPEPVPEPAKPAKRGAKKQTQEWQVIFGPGRQHASISLDDAKTEADAKAYCVKQHGAKSFVSVRLEKIS